MRKVQMVTYEYKKNMRMVPVVRTSWHDVRLRKG